MDCKIVIRIMDGDRMLGWAEAQALARGDGKIWIEGDTSVAIVDSGIWTHTSAHWTDVNIEVRTPGLAFIVSSGSILPLKGPWQVFNLGEPAGGLPPVTVGRNVSITVPTGSLAAVGNRA